LLSVDIYSSFLEKLSQRFQVRSATG
jgi:hypothetical protein